MNIFFIVLVFVGDNYVCIEKNELAIKQFQAIIHFFYLQEQMSK